MNSSSSGAGDRNNSTTSSATSNNNNNDSAPTEDTTSNLDNNPYADDFKNISVSDEPVPQTVVEARQDDKIFLFGQSLMDTGGSRSLIARSRIPTGVKIQTLKDNYSAMSAAGPVELKSSFLITSASLNLRCRYGMQMLSSLFLKTMNTQPMTSS